MRIRLWLTARWEWIVTVAPSFAEFSVTALNPQFGMLIAGNLTACRNRIALLGANGRQTFAAFSAGAPLISNPNNVLILAHLTHLLSSSHVVSIARLSFRFAVDVFE